MIKLVLSDMDQTLKPADTPAISERTHKAINNLKAAGIAFGLSTGRPVYDALSYLKSDVSLTDTGVFSSGKILYFNGKLIFTKQFTYEMMEKIYEVISPMDDCLLTYYQEGPLEQPLDTSFTSCWKIVDTTQEVVDHLAASFNTFVPGLGPQSVPKDIPMYAGGLLLPQDEKRAQEIYEAVTSAVPEVELVSPYIGWFDINYRGWNKAQGFEKLIETIGLKPEEVIVCGDSENDLDLLKIAHHSCCMENGTDEAKSVSKYLLPSVYEEGVAQLLEALTEAQGDFDSEVVQAVLKRTL